jgi:hypothetical protein
MNNHIAFVNPNFSDQSKSIDEVNTWCKIELTWIMCNLCMADASLVNSLFETDALGYNSILQHISNFLSSSNFQEVEQILWMIGNLTSEYNQEIQEVLIGNLNLCQRLSTICSQETIPVSIMNNISWII